MKRLNIIYWVTTGLVSAFMLFSAALYLTHNEALVASFKTIGFPVFFITILGVAKLTGAIVLVAPVNAHVKEWAYAGFAFTFIGATWTHLATSTPWIMPFVFLIILGVSYYSWIRKTNTGRAVAS